MSNINDCTKFDGNKWNETEFNLLGLKFSVDLSKMLEINYAAKMIEIRSQSSIGIKDFSHLLVKLQLLKHFYYQNLITYS